MAKKELTIEAIDKLLQKRISENNRVLMNGMEELMDFKIQQSEERMSRKMSKQHSEVMNTLDAFVGEIKTSREERTTQAHQIIRNTRRIEKLEQAH